MKYAVIRTGGKQYRVSEGEVVKVEKLAGEVGEKVTLGRMCFLSAAKAMPRLARHWWPMRK